MSRLSKYLFTFLYFSSSDETDRKFVYRTDGTRFQPGHTVTLKTSGRVTVNVWGWFSSEGAGSLHRITGRLNAEKYVDILENVLLPVAIERFERGNDYPIRFVQDRSPIHTANVVRERFEEHPEFELLPWPPKGADLNPIENMWSEMVRDLESQQVQSADRLWEKVCGIWDGLKHRQDYWKLLARSMPSRLNLVREMAGDWTKY